MDQPGLTSRTRLLLFLVVICGMVLTGSQYKRLKQPRCSPVPPSTFARSQSLLCQTIAAVLTVQVAYVL